MMLQQNHLQQQMLAAMDQQTRIPTDLGQRVVEAAQVAQRASSSGGRVVDTTLTTPQVGSLGCSGCH